MLQARINWKHRMYMLNREGQFTNMYRMSYSSYQKLFGILKPKLLLYEKQAQNHFQGQEPIVAEIYFHCMHCYLAGGAYQENRTMVVSQLVSFTMPYTRVLMQLTLWLN